MKKIKVPKWILPVVVLSTGAVIGYLGRPIIEDFSFKKEVVLSIEDSLKAEIVQSVNIHTTCREEQIGDWFVLYTDSCEEKGYVLHTETDEYASSHTNGWPTEKYYLYENNIIGTYDYIDSMKCIEFNKAYDYLYKEYQKDSLLKILNNKKCQ